MLATEHDSIYGNYQKKHEENFLKIAENRLRKAIPDVNELPRDIIMDGETLGGNGVKLNLYQ